MRTLTGRTVLVTALVAVVSVIITAAVALPVMVRAGNADARRSLVDRANLTARLLNAVDSQEPTERQLARVRSTLEGLREQGVTVVVIEAGEPDLAGLAPRIVAEVAAGRPVSQRVLWQGEAVLAEGRPVGREGGDGFVLLASASVSVRTVLGRLWLALLAGLGAGGLAGLVLARRLGRPLRHAAAAARRISDGDRTVRLAVSDTAEVAAVSSALNELAAALATSEDRQRTFLTSISHELRTPLTTMKGYAEALADGVIDAAGARHAGATILAEGERLDRLVEDLLALARLEADDFPLELAAVDLGQLATDAAASWRARCAAAGVTLGLEAPPQPVVVRTDAGRVRQVLDGLLDNAVRAVEAGTPIVVAVRAVTSADGGADGAAVIEVRDGGPGFTDEDLAVLFDRGALYERYKGVRKVGSGLGLALAHRLVARLGGHVEAGHAPEGGARFGVVLPR